jgi:hypothetical protein
MSKSLKYQVLSRARELIADKKDWTQIVYARTKSGREVDAWDRRAVRFCAAGAIVHANYELTSRTPSDLADLGHTRIAGITISQLECIEAINDRDGHAAVLRKLDTMIAKA